jgi:hypothetical protein
MAPTSAGGGEDNDEEAGAADEDNDEEAGAAGENAPVGPARVTEGSTVCSATAAWFPTLAGWVTTIAPAATVPRSTPSSNWFTRLTPINTPGASTKLPD